MASPTMAHLNLSKHVLRYLKGTIGHGLLFKKCNPDNLCWVGYSDASWANSPDRRSISGYCFSVGEGNSFISWKSKKQGIVALSSCESEYIALAYAVQEAIFLQQLCRDMYVLSECSTMNINVDNMGAIDLSMNPIHHQRSKHIDTRFHFVRSKIADGTISLSYCPSNENKADVFTKPCTKQSLAKFAVY